MDTTHPEGEGKKDQSPVSGSSLGKAGEEAHWVRRLPTADADPSWEDLVMHLVMFACRWRLVPEGEDRQCWLLESCLLPVQPCLSLSCCQS